jgi:hypothetical protein
MAFLWLKEDARKVNISRDAHIRGLEGDGGGIILNEKWRGRG